MMDIAMTLDVLVPGAEYGGSLTANTREAYEALRWEDERPKPAWSEIEAAQPRVEARTEAEAAREALRELDRELCDGCEAVMEHIGPERMPQKQRERLEAKREARQRIQKHEEAQR